MGASAIEINRAPVLTLWGAVVAQRLGYDWPAALTLGKALAGLTAQSKGRNLGIFSAPPGEGGRAPKKAGLGEEMWIRLCGRSVPAKNTGEGVRSVVKDSPVTPQSVESYLTKGFGEALGSIKSVMEEVAASYEAEELNEIAFGLYERFRPKIDPGTRGWGQKGRLDPAAIRSLRRA